MNTQPATFLKRACALFIDILLKATPATLAEAGARGANPHLNDQYTVHVVELFKLAIWYVYFSTMHSIFGFTVGKKALKICVIDKLGETPSFLSSSLRFLGFILSVLTFFAGFMMAAFRKDKKALHDILSGTQVVCEAQRGGGFRQA